MLADRIIEHQLQPNEHQLTILAILISVQKLKSSLDLSLFKNVSWCGRRALAVYDRTVKSDKPV